MVFNYREEVHLDPKYTQILDDIAKIKNCIQNLEDSKGVFSLEKLKLEFKNIMAEIERTQYGKKKRVMLIEAEREYHKRVENFADQIRSVEDEVTFTDLISNRKIFKDFRHYKRDMVHVFQLRRDDHPYKMNLLASLVVDLEDIQTWLKEDLETAREWLKILRRYESLPMENLTTETDIKYKQQFETYKSLISEYENMLMKVKILKNETSALRHMLREKEFQERERFYDEIAKSVLAFKAKEEEVTPPTTPELHSLEASSSSSSDASSKVSEIEKDSLSSAKEKTIVSTSSSVQKKVFPIAAQSPLSPSPLVFSPAKNLIEESQESKIFKQFFDDLNNKIIGYYRKKNVTNIQTVHQIFFLKLISDEINQTGALNAAEKILALREAYKVVEAEKGSKLYVLIEDQIHAFNTAIKGLEIENPDNEGRAALKMILNGSLKMDEPSPEGFQEYLAKIKSHYHINPIKKHT